MSLIKSFHNKEEEKMKKHCKLTLFFCFAALLLTLLAFAVSAESYESDAAALEGGMAVRVGAEGGEYFATLADAVSATVSGNTVTVLAAHTTPGVTITTDITVEGGGHLITQTGRLNVGVDNVTTASVVFNNVSLKMTANAHSVYVLPYSVLTVNGEKSGISQESPATTAYYGFLVQGELTVNDGYYTATTAANRRLVWANTTTSVVTINGGVFDAGAGNNRCLGFSYGVFTVNGGTFIARKTNVLFMEGDRKDLLLEISGGEFVLESTAPSNATILEVRGSTNDLVITGGTSENKAAGGSIARLTQQTTTVMGGSFTSAGAGFMRRSNSS